MRSSNDITIIFGYLYLFQILEFFPFDTTPVLLSSMVFPISLYETPVSGNSQYMALKSARMTKYISIVLDTKLGGDKSIMTPGNYVPLLAHCAVVMQR